MKGINSVTGANCCAGLQENKVTLYSYRLYFGYMLAIVSNILVLELPLLMQCDNQIYTVFNPIQRHVCVLGWFS